MIVIRELEAEAVVIGIYRCLCDFVCSISIVISYVKYNVGCRYNVCSIYKYTLEHCLDPKIISETGLRAMYIALR